MVVRTAKHPRENFAVTLPVARALRKRLMLQRIRDKVAFLTKNPEFLTEDDLDLLCDADGRQTRRLFEAHPHIKRRFEEYRDTPEMISADPFTFMRRAWSHAMIPDLFVSNWHHRLINTALRQLATGEITRLIVNIPPGMTKTLLFQVFFPAWRWAVSPGESFLNASYSEEIPCKAAQNFLALIHSDWYQRRWGHNFRVIKDSSREISNNKGGFRLARGIGGGTTGQHPDYLIVDDPSKGNEVYSEAAMKAVINWFASTVVSRGAVKGAKIAVVMQRLAMNDLCGVILGETSDDSYETRQLPGKLGWHHVCLPMRFDPDHPYRHPDDPRTVKGQLLWPEMLPEEKVLRMREEMCLNGANVADAQMQQNPKMTGTRIFKYLDQALIEPSLLPRELTRRGIAVRAWDRAGTENAGDWTAGVLGVELEGCLYILDVIRMRKEPSARDACILQAAKDDLRMFDRYYVANEVMPNPDGKQVHRDLSLHLSKLGISCLPCRPSTSKKERAAQPAYAIESGTIKILARKKWTYDFMRELEFFPDGAHDDQVDAFAHVYHCLNDIKLSLV